MKSYSSMLGPLVYICTDYFNQYTILIFNQNLVIEIEDKLLLLACISENLKAAIHMRQNLS